MIKKIGLYFGSFNPPTIAHLLSAHDVVTHTDIDKIWFVPTPLNPHKSGDEMVNFEHRVNMLNLCAQDSKYYDVCDLERHMSQPNYTINTLKYIKESYDHNFVLVMGDDVYDSIDSWYKASEIKQEDIYVLPRTINQYCVVRYNNNEFIEEFPVNNVRDGSSTEFRDGKNRNLVLNNVKQYIKENDLYHFSELYHF